MSIEKKTIKPAQKEFGKEFDDYWLGPTFSADKKIQRITDRFKRNVLKKMISLDPKELNPKTKKRKDKKLPDELIVSVKRDGGYYTYYYDIHSEPESIFCNSPNGRAVYNLPVSKEMDARIKEINDSQLKEMKGLLSTLTNLNLFEAHDTICKIVLAGELFANITKEDDRPRVFDLIKLMMSPESKEQIELINYDVFDIISLNDVDLLNLPYEKRLKLIEFLFPRKDDAKAGVIEHEKGVEAADVYKLYGKWVEKQNHEGLVIRTKFNMLYKVKSIFELDAVIIGFVEMLEEKTLEGEEAISSVLLALMRPDGTFQELCRMGGGLSYEQRVELYELLKDEIVKSQFRASKGDGRAYHFVRPKYIVQIKYMDLVTEGALGDAIRRMALRFENDTWTPLRSVPFVSVISPRFDTLRTIVDEKKYKALNYVNPKEVKYDDLKIDQVLDLIPIETPASVQELENLPKSKILLRVVFEGKWAGVLSAHKIMLWATNKRDVNLSYPNYVVYHASYNYYRNTPLEQDVYPFNTLEKAIQHVDWIFTRPDNPDQGMFDKTGTKLKRSIVTPPYSLHVDPDTKTTIAKNLGYEVRKVLLEEESMDELMDDILDLTEDDKQKKSGKKKPKRDKLDEMLDLDLDSIDFDDL